MNHVEARSFAALLSDYRVAETPEARDLRYLALKKYVEGYARRTFRALVDAGVALEVKRDTPRGKAESLTALLHEARVLAGELALELPTEGGRIAARQVERVLGRGGDVEFNDSGLQVDAPRLDCCSGPIADIDESLKPHIEEEAQTSAEAA